VHPTYNTAKPKNVWSMRYLLAFGWTMMIGTMACTPPIETVESNVVIDTDDADVLLDRYTDSYRDDGSNMRILITNEDAYEGFKEVVESAEQTIHIETLYFDDDSPFDQNISMEFAELLADKARQGVRVRLLIDGGVQSVMAPPEINETLLEAGVEMVEYFPPVSQWSANYLLYRTHKKILVSDGQQAIIGGSNYGYRYMGPDQWRDSNVLFTGPVVSTIQRDFLRDWAAVGGQIESGTESLLTLEKTGPLSIRYIDQRPAAHDFDINQMLLIALRLADDFVLMEAPYFNPTDWLVDEILDASARGVEIRILTNAKESMDVDASYPVLASWFEPMLTNDIRVFLWELTGSTMHSKALVVDDKLAMIGTHNFNSRSIVWDTENVAVFTDPSAIAETDAMIRHDLAEPHVYEIDFDWLAINPVDDQDLGGLSSLFQPYF